MKLIPRCARGLLAAALAAGGAVAAPAFHSGAEKAFEPSALATPDGAAVIVGAAADGVLGTVLLFVSTECAASREAAATLNDWAGDYGEEGFLFHAVDANFRESAASCQAFAAQLELGFPLLLDPLQTLAERLEVTHNGTAVVVDAARRVRYRGPVEGGPEGADLVTALEALLMEEDGVVALEQGNGSPLASVWEPGGGDDVQYHRDVAPILARHCLECHRPGEAAPMSFEDYEEVRGWAPMIAEVAGTGRMPPWHASPVYGSFRNERRLTDAEKLALVRWGLSGASEGTPENTAAAPQFPEGAWRHGTPDWVVEVPEVQQIPAEGTIPYRYLTVNPHLTEDVWIRGVDVIPGNRLATHHVILYVVPEGMSWRDFLRDTSGALGDGLLAGYAPGSRTELLEEGLGIRIARGSTFLFELHYTAVGTPQTDLSKVGFYFAPEGELTEVHSLGIAHFNLDIPPREPAVEYQAEHVFRNAASLRSLSPHMHSRGKAFRYELIPADGEPRTLLDVPAYDFNWQHTYYFREPQPVEAGDRLRVTAVYDNSPDNPSNPDPDAHVRWGDQTWEEMMIGFVTYVDAE